MHNYELRITNYTRRTIVIFTVVLAACGPITISEITPTQPPPTAAPPTATVTFTPLPTFAPPTETPTPTITPSPNPADDPVLPRIHSAEETEAIISDNETIPWLVTNILEDYRLGTRTEPLELSARLTTEAITWDNWWCAASDALLAGNLAVMEFTYTINEEEIDIEESAYVFRQFLQNGAVCEVTAFYLSEWPSGEYDLNYTFTLTGNMNDGFATYAAGDYVTTYKVTAP